MDSRRRSRRGSFILATLLLAISEHTIAIPYTPTSVFLPPQYNDSLAYLLQSSDSPDGKVEFLSLNLSASINSDNPSYTTLLKEIPFQSPDQPSAFVPVLDESGAITVYAGGCDSSSQQTLWRFSPERVSSTGNGSWDQLSINPGNSQTRPNYLAGGFTFASTSTGESSIYAFGGMCPFANSTDETWVSAANYSQTMVLLEPTSQDSTIYDATTTGYRAPPVSEAGMVIVPLPATSAAASTERQQEFLFIGGHTQQAFLNMSQLALFSVPQESWSFVAVNSEPRPKTELTVRSQPIEPRSGHAAVLSDDGKKVFLIGGWVGDISIPAEPQFAILELGQDYGGDGEWAWSVPSSTPAPGLSKGTGLFGHSAVMLPGGVLMIAGGYNIPNRSSKRALSPMQRNSQLYLYNTTSDNWVNSYTNPAFAPAKVSVPTSSSGSSSDSASTSTSTSHKGGLSSSQKIGLGVGLALGVPIAIFIALCALVRYRKHRVRNQRDSQLRELALGAERAHFWARDEPYQSSSIRSSQMSERRDSPANRPLIASLTRPLSKEESEGSGERTGLLNKSPSPGKNSRPVSQHKSYRPSAFVEFRRSDNTSEIHPIDEREEDEAMFRERLLATIPTNDRPGIHDPEDPFTDTPFATPRSTILGVGLGPFYTRRKNNSSTNAGGRISPTKSDRTTSSLSDVSAFSFSSSNHTPQVSTARAIVIERPLSWASSGELSSEQLAVASTRSREIIQSDMDGMTGMTAPSEKSFSTDSYSTAQTTICQHHAEAESLLYHGEANTPTEPSPSKLPPGSKPRPSDGLFQTMRRALTLSRRNTSDDETAPLASGIDRRSTVISSDKFSNGSGTSSPRRAVSASAELFRRKQSAKDRLGKKRMSDVVFEGPRSSRDDPFLGAPGYLGDDDTCDENWDESQRVQMTYTVPREKLRVVNASARDMDNVSERSISRTLSNTASTRRVSN